jgi:hypothetical protein
LIDRLVSLHHTALVPSPKPQPLSPHRHTHRRVWHTWSLTTGADVTWGALDSMAKALKITPMELEGSAVEMPEGERCVLFVCAYMSARGVVAFCLSLRGVGSAQARLTIDLPAIET